MGMHGNAFIHYAVLYRECINMYGATQMLRMCNGGHTARAMLVDIMKSPCRGHAGIVKMTRKHPEDVARISRRCPGDVIDMSQKSMKLNWGSHALATKMPSDCGCMSLGCHEDVMKRS